MDSFSNSIYKKEQVRAFMDKLGKDISVIEFWWKPWNDLHASRVLPWYDPDIKCEIIRSLEEELDSDIVMVVNYRDIAPKELGWRYLKWRIRWDSQLFYDQEVIRLKWFLKEKGILVSKVVLSIVPQELSGKQNKYLNKLIKWYQKNWLKVSKHFEIDWYPNPKILDDNLHLQASSVSDTIMEDRNLVLLSPWWWSWKFWVAYIELLKKIISWYTPNFVKFETFPVFNLPEDHPLNLAFEAATADLNNIVSSDWNFTTYDKDIDNHKLIRDTYIKEWLNSHIIAKSSSPEVFAVNVIEKWILEMDKVLSASFNEIQRRKKRYEQEIINWIESPATIIRMNEIMSAAKKSIWYYIWRIL